MTELTRTINRDLLVEKRPVALTTTFFTKRGRKGNLDNLYIYVLLTLVSWVTIFKEQCWYIGHMCQIWDRPDKFKCLFLERWLIVTFTNLDFCRKTLPTFDVCWCVPLLVHYCRHWCCSHLFWLWPGGFIETLTRLLVGNREPSFHAFMHWLRSKLFSN